MAEPWDRRAPARHDLKRQSRVDAARDLHYSRCRRLMSGILRTTRSQKIKVVIVLLLLILLGSVLVSGVGKAPDKDAVRAALEREWLKGEGAFFVRKTCTSCHSISALGIKAATVGPDLSEAVADTERRFGKTIEQFFDHPSGTMSIVLSTRIPLTEAEKLEAIRLLRVAYQRRLEQQSRLK